MLFECRLFDMRRARYEQLYCLFADAFSYYIFSYFHILLILLRLFSFALRKSYIFALHIRLLLDIFIIYFCLFIDEASSAYLWRVISALGFLLLFDYFISL